MQLPESLVLDLRLLHGRRLVPAAALVPKQLHEKLGAEVEAFVRQRASKMFTLTQISGIAVIAIMKESRHPQPA